MKSSRKIPLKPRNPVALNPLLRKGGAHSRKNKKAKRPLQKKWLRKTLAEEIKGTSD
jgi:hypothetical protein